MSEVQEKQNITQTPENQKPSPFSSESVNTKIAKA
jgi:hypothetical protein